MSGFRDLLIAVMFLILTVNYDCQIIESFYNFFNPYSVDVVPLDEIPASPDCKDCPRVYLPICADDNVTYTNVCKLTCANENKKKNPKAKFVRTGACQIFPDLK